MSLKQKIEDRFEGFIFASRWIQMPLYTGLIIASVLYAYKFIVELIHLALHIQKLTEYEILLGILGLMDITMVANLLFMVIIGGYSTFVSRIHLSQHVDRPDWLDKMDGGTLKIKMASSLAIVSGIHLLRSFMNLKNLTAEEVKWQIIIHCVFLVSTLILALTERIMHPPHTGKEKEQSGGKMGPSH